MDVRRTKKELEFIWAPNGTVGGDEDGIFTVNFASGEERMCMTTRVIGSFREE